MVCDSDKGLYLRVSLLTRAFVNPDFHLAIGARMYDIKIVLVAKGTFTQTAKQATEARYKTWDVTYISVDNDFTILTDGRDRCPSICQAGSVHNTGLPLSVGDLFRWRIC